MFRQFILLSNLLFVYTSLWGQSSHTIDEFKNNADYFTAFNNGSGSVSTSISTTEFSSGTSSLAVNYSFNAGIGYFFSSFRGYGTATQDYSFQTASFSIDHKGGNANSTISIRLWEDINLNGAFDGTDEVFTSNVISIGTASWTTSIFLLTNFIRVAGAGNNTIDLNRVRGWDVKIQNTLSTSNSGLVYVDNFQLNSTYTPPSTGNALLSGSFTQLWNTAGCNCGQWTQTQWENEFQEMKGLCMDKFIVQYSVYNDLSWYSNSSLPYVLYKETALDKIILAAENTGMKIYFGLYFDENWNSSDKALSSTYSSLLTKHQGVIDELWTNFGSSIAFGGWYIPQELNDFEWQQDPKKSLLFNWLNDVSTYAHTKTSAPVVIAPFFNLWQPADIVATWYNELLTAAPNLDAVYPQDGVGITLKSPTYHVPLYYQQIKNVCTTHGVRFGGTIESFSQQTGWPIDGGSFSAISTDINRLKTQLWNAELTGTSDLIQFEWSYMQNGLTASSTTLNADYSSYATPICSTLPIMEKLNFKTLSKQNTLISYPNPVINYLTIEGEINLSKIQFINSTGQNQMESITYTKNGIHTLLNLSNLNPGVYFIISEELNQLIIKQ